MENQKNEQEIDLVHILSVIWRLAKSFFAQLKNFGVWSLRFVYRNRRYLLGALVCAVAFTAFWGRPGNRKYEMENEMRISVSDAYFFKDLIAGLNYKCKSLDALGLSSSLGLPTEITEKIRSINGYYIVDKMLDNTPDEVCYGEYEADTTKQIMNDRLVVRVTIDDSTLIDTVANAMLRYFEGNEYVKNVNMQRIAQIEARIANLNNEVIMLDSLRKYEYFVKRGREMKLDGPLIVSERSTQLYYNDILSLAKQRDENILEKAVFPNAVNYVRDFVLVKETNKYPRTFVCSLVAFVVLALTIAFFSHNRKAIKSFLENKG